MSCNCKGCGFSRFAGILMKVGGVNWGLVGVGMLMGSNMNLVNILLGSWPTVESIVYVLVGVSTLVAIFGCPCKKCKEGCAACQVEAGAPKM
mgnify:FL=1